MANNKVSYSTDHIIYHLKMEILARLWENVYILLVMSVRWYLMSKEQFGVNILTNKNILESSNAPRIYSGQVVPTADDSVGTTVYHVIYVIYTLLESPAFGAQRVLSALQGNLSSTLICPLELSIFK